MKFKPDVGQAYFVPGEDDAKIKFLEDLGYTFTVSREEFCEGDRLIDQEREEPLEFNTLEELLEFHQKLGGKISIYEDDGETILEMYT